MSGNGIKPTNPEIELGKLLDQLYPNQYKYVGDGKRIIGGMCPDFIHQDGTFKVIELFGDYWHKGENPQDRIDAFIKYAPIRQSKGPWSSCKFIVYFFAL